MDGKTVRGARRPDGPQVHLLSAMNKAGPVLAQREADAKSNEITAIQPLPAPLEPAGCVVTLERVCAVISLAAHQADAAEIARRVRGHWGIGNRLHHVRDTDFAEGAPRIRTGAEPRAMAALRNLAIGALHLAGCYNFAAGLRRHSRDITRPLTTSGNT
ncbi:hypothetical protein [Streptomyces sp. NBC_01237]|uniref:hypothetical protein n=1 Tax=Streptomyces sp. NBC_01237 TaxID=2903790 RepID=UPI002DDBD5E5|nr:hypothetical protein [Streptomyces sp. NBC_01237]WRZ70348.1 hypothetical protein OG251_01235 [Streptomyces sp. NBC_01237]